MGSNPIIPILFLQIIHKEVYLNDLFEFLNLTRYIKVGTSSKRGLFIEHKNKVFHVNPIEIVGATTIKEGVERNLNSESKHIESVNKELFDVLRYAKKFDIGLITLCRPLVMQYKEKIFLLELIETGYCSLEKAL